jgi:hypothetical protein
MNTVPRPTASSVRRGWNDSSMCMRQPVNRLKCAAKESPWIWNRGRTLTTTSSGVNRQALWSARKLEARLAWVCTTPLGWPVVPELYNIRHAA